MGRKFKRGDVVRLEEVFTGDLKVLNGRTGVIEYVNSDPEFYCEVKVYGRSDRIAFRESELILLSKRLSKRRTWNLR